MHTDTLPPPPAVIHVPTMTREEANETSREAGEAIASVLASLRADAAETLRRCADIQAAWAEHDWTWLAETGVISRRVEADLIAIDLEF